MSQNNFTLIAPYRDRATHLARFLPHYTSLFPTASILVVEQGDDQPFNRGWLLNVGFLLSTTDYVIMNDIDMICAAGEKMYQFPPAWPTLLATHVQQFGYRLPFPEYFGGAVMFTREQFEQVDGYSNLFTGWGGEDNELYDAVKRARMGIAYRKCYHSSLPHEREVQDFQLPADHPNTLRWKRYARDGRDEGDGLHACAYTITSDHASGNIRHVKIN